MKRAVALLALLIVGLTSCERDPPCEEELLGYVNQARSDYGVHPLIWDKGDVDKVPLDWAIHVSFERRAYHNPNYGAQIAQYRSYWIVGENVGGSSGGIPLMFRTFMDSPSHRANILRPEFRYTALACIRQDDGSQWVTQNFWG